MNNKTQWRLWIPLIFCIVVIFSVGAIVGEVYDSWVHGFFPFPQPPARATNTGPGVVSCHFNSQFPESVTISSNDAPCSINLPLSASLVITSSSATLEDLLGIATITAPTSTPSKPSDIRYIDMKPAPTSTPQVKEWNCGEYSGGVRSSTYLVLGGMLVKTTGTSTPESEGYSDCTQIQ
jgi:hypothetical protein